MHSVSSLYSLCLHQVCTDRDINDPEIQAQLKKRINDNVLKDLLNYNKECKNNLQTAVVASITLFVQIRLLGERNEKLDKISKALFNYISGIQKSGIFQKHEACSFQFDSEFVFTEVDKFCKDCEEYNPQKLTTLVGNIKNLTNGMITFENLQSIIELDSLLKISYLFKRYGVPTNAPCTNCNKKWTEREKVDGDYYISCLFCGYEGRDE